MSASDNIVAETAARIFTDLADPQTVNAAKDESWKSPLWSALEENGLTLAWVPEDLGGAGASLADGFEVINVAGRFAAPVPIAETLLAGWLLSQGRIASLSGMMTLAPMRPNDRITHNPDGTLSGRARGVPFARDAAHVAVLAHGANGMVVALVETRSARIVDNRGIAGNTVYELTFDKAKPVGVADAPAGFGQDTLMLMGAVVRSLATAGALEAILDISVRYAGERVAFERTISKFQAVQHNLARLAGESAAASAAATSAADAVANADTLGSHGIYLEAASARIRSAEAATEGAAIAHQVHGAIGYTKEHILHRFTQRLLTWRDDFGNESQWAVDLGNRVAAAGAEELWPLVASR
ncbi:MAG: acyl-CoA dehydrogenase family protein [Hyphomicrobiaceae bacterium]|nr:acyl-CoA dehydrogenase family protein [Hyphomicrobiaceae bacterium]